MTCLVCLREDVDVLYIFGEEGTRLEMPLIIMEHFWFEPIENDPILSRICLNCWKQISSFHSFYATVKQAHRKLSESYFTSQDISQIDNEDCVVEEKHNFKVVEEQNASGHDLPDITLVPLGKKSKLQNNCNYEVEHNDGGNFNETTGFFVGQGNQFSETSNFYEQNTTDCHENHSHDCYPGGEQDYKYENDCTEEDPSPNVDQNLLQYQEPSSKIHEKLAVVSQTSSHTTRRSRDKNRTKSEDDLIAKYINLICELCDTKFETFVELSSHYHLAHKISGYVRCCGRKLPSRAYVLDHINKHINPDNYVCKECNKSFSSQFAIKNHMAMKHVPEVEKTFKCPQCPKGFTSQITLNKHSSVHISDEKRHLYCAECKKMFSNSIAIQMHRNVYHKKVTGHICHVCGKVVRGKSLFVKHINDHIKKLGAETVKNDPVCPLCGKLSASVKTLRHHIRYVHSSDRPHKCQICHKGFKIRQKLKEHMGTHARGTTIQCPYCPKRFRSKIHLYSHKYRMHKIEYEKEKLRKFSSYRQICGKPNESPGEMKRREMNDVDLDENNSSNDCFVVT